MNNELNCKAFKKSLTLCIAAIIFVMPVFSLAETQSIEAVTKTLNALIETAIAADPNRSQYAIQSEAMRDMGVASSILMSPKLRLGLGALPVDSFKLDEDPMTNISVGLMQQFERGSTLKLNQQKADQQAEGLGWQVQIRERDIATTISQLWLELGYLQQAEKLIKENRNVMNEMERFVKTNYSLGRSEAQDLLNTQLQVSKLNEKLQANQQMQRRTYSLFSEWLGADWLVKNKMLKASYRLNWDRLEQILAKQSNKTQFHELLNQHPMIRMADTSIAANQTQVDVARQAYKPQFGVELMYGYRQANGMNGQPASDIVSAFLTMDLPIFTGDKQDKNLSAALYQEGAARFQKDTLLAQMNAQVNAFVVDRENLSDRIKRYQYTLIPQAKSRIKAVERGYQNNTAQFGEVLGATTDEITMRLEYVRLVTDLNIANTKLAALLGGFDYQASKPILKPQNN